VDAARGTEFAQGGRDVVVHRAWTAEEELVDCLRVEQDARELAELETLGTIYTRIERMRIIPFDLRSFGQLIGSSLGAVATLLPLLYEKGELTVVVEALGRIMGR
jgi:hypothetical protein